MNTNEQIEKELANALAGAEAPAEEPVEIKEEISAKELYKLTIKKLNEERYAMQEELRLLRDQELKVREQAKQIALRRKHLQWEIKRKRIKIEEITGHLDHAVIPGETVTPLPGFSSDPIGNRLAWRIERNLQGRAVDPNDPNPGAARQIRPFHPPDRIVDPHPANAVLDRMLEDQYPTDVLFAAAIEQHVLALERAAT